MERKKSASGPILGERELRDEARLDSAYFVSQSASMHTIFSEGTRGWRRLPHNGERIFVAHRWLSIIILAVLVLVVAGGASGAQGAEFQQGSYSRTRLRGDKVILKFGDRRRFVLSDQDGNTLLEGTYKVMNDQIELTDEKGPFAAKDANPGKYKWNLADRKLSFTKIEDESEGRSRGITGSTWTLEK